jgi:hypothetical protein
MSSSDLNTLKKRLRANTRPTRAEARDWDVDVYGYTNAVWFKTEVLITLG